MKLYAGILLLLWWFRVAVATSLNGAATAVENVDQTPLSRQLESAREQSRGQRRCICCSCGSCYLDSVRRQAKNYRSSFCTRDLICVFILKSRLEELLRLKFGKLLRLINIKANTVLIVSFACQQNK